VPAISHPDHFSDSAPLYAAFRPDYPPQLFAWIAEAAPALERAWDCATGSGQAAVGMAQHFREVVATDASERQLAYARPHPRVTYRAAAAEDCGLPPASVDAVTVAQAMHWFRLPAFHAEVRRVLRPGGIFAAWCYAAFTVDDAELDARLHAFYAGTLGPYWPPEREYVATGYRTLPFPYEEITPPETFEMVREWPMEALVGYLRTWSACRMYARATGHDAVDRLAPSLAAAWGDVRATRTFRWPLFIRAGRTPRVS
jgi:ubiquinone/menaquinone biosynthesis C-methylase UbiE